ncbi:CHAT domain-containing protein [Streptomyces sp. NBC_00343]|uniref:CHAT domain-containing protein n=1 Tax=Streptomyces sp. NBC_00343 TaxID=2975719 RepID=UPI002E2B33E7|nr:CHAT domain-containing protein [Streptomyces sp. NBC_00343]
MLPELPPTPPPGALELAILLSFTTRIEPELIRAVRLRLLPSLNAGDEADLWFCDWIGARAPEAIALLPQCLPYLRAELVERLEQQPRLREVRKIVSELHHGLSPALLLEEQITWESLVGDKDTADAYLQRALHALVREGRSGLADWFAEAWGRLPEQARSTVGGWALANASKAHVRYLDPGQAPEIDLASVELIAEAVGEARLGVLREAGTLLLGQVRGPQAAAILVPDTHPRVVEVVEGDRRRTVRVAAGHVVSVPVRPGSVGLRTGGGQVYEIGEFGPVVPPVLPERNVDAHLADSVETLLDEIRSRGLTPPTARALTNALREYLDLFLREDDFTALRDARQLAGNIESLMTEPRSFPGLATMLVEVLAVHGRRVASRPSLQHALSLGRQLAEHHPSQGLSRLQALLAAASRELFLCTGEIRHLDYAMDMLWNVAEAEAASPTENARLVAIEFLDTCVVFHELRPRPALLHDALRTAERLATPTDPLVSGPMARLALAIQAVDGGLINLDRAWQLALSAAPRNRPSSARAEQETLFASVSLARFWTDADIQSLTEALTHSRSALRLVSPDDRLLRARMQLALSDVLRLCQVFDPSEKMLREALKLAERAVRAFHKSSVDRQKALLTQSRLLTDLFRVTGDQEFLDRSLSAADDTAFVLGARDEGYPGDWERRPPSFPPLKSFAHHHTVLTQRARVLLLKFHAGGGGSALGGAIEGFMRSLENLPDGLSPEAGLHVAEGLAEAASAPGAENVSPNSFRWVGFALEHPPGDRSFEYSEGYTQEAFMALAAALVLAHRLDRDRVGASRGMNAIRVLRIAALDQRVSPLRRLRMATAWGDLAERFGLADEVVRSYETTAKDLELVLMLAPDRPVEFIGTFEARSRQAAAYAIQEGNLVLALEFLEQRSTVLSMWRGRTHALMTRLHEVSPAHANDLHQLWIVANLEADHAGCPPSRQRNVGVRRLEALVTAVRSLPGLGGFLASQPSPLHAVADEGPLVILNSADLRCDALLVTHDGIGVLPLPELSLPQVAQYAERYGQAGILRPEIRGVLEWLWRGTVRPVLRGLGFEIDVQEFSPAAENDKHPDRSETLPRLWWCPTGPFTRLPLHLAGVQDHKALDYVVSSYTPSARALVDARRDRRSIRHRSQSRMLVVIGDERSREADWMPGLTSATVLSGSDATRAKAMAYLQEHSFFHFSGHAHHDAGPYLQLHGSERIDSQDLAQRHVPDGALAYLSTCGTSMDDSGVEGGGWSLATDLQVAGFRHVIAFLGQITDDLAARLSQAVYAQLLGDDQELHADHAALALHRVVVDLTESSPADYPLLSVVHLGP